MYIFLNQWIPLTLFFGNRSNGQTKGAICPRKKMCHPRENDPIGEDDTTLVVGFGVLDHLIVKFDTLDTIFIFIFIFAQSTFFSGQLSQLHQHMEKSFLVIDGQPFCYIDQLQALEDFIHQHLP